MRSLLAAATLFLPILVGQGEQMKQILDKDFASELPRLAPKEPKDAAATFKVAPGFTIELAASEPAIRSPVAVDFDEDGRMYVAEFPEYNQQSNPKFKERGAIKLLEDTKGTGVYDKVTTLAEIDSPVAVACWDGGVFVGAVPHIYYLKDTKGTGKADLKKIIYTGFGRDKAGEAMLNSFRWGLDNRFHVSTSAAGGDVKRATFPSPQRGRGDVGEGVKSPNALPPHPQPLSPKERGEKSVNVRGHGFIFDPRSMKFELVAGSAQHGMSMDDWGRKFTCDNSNPCYLQMYDGRYLLKNPYVEAPPPLVNIHNAERKNYLKRISPNEPWRILRTQLRLKGVVPGPTETGEVSGHFTGTTGVTVYRGDAFPANHRGTLFVGEVANNLVYHAKLEPKGLTLNAARFEKDIEFLASTDTWFRPVQFANAPDGTLYVIDCYREIIETTESIPPVILKHLNIEAGVNRGRIWRVVPDNFKRPTLPRLSKATTAELVKLLDHPNGWHRDTAARLLYQRQDADAIPHLNKLAKDPRSPLAHIYALYALAGLDALRTSQIDRALIADDAHVREHALRLAERFPDDALIRSRMHEMVEDKEIAVRYQLAFSLGRMEEDVITKTLHRLAIRDGKDPWMRLAILTSARDVRGGLFRSLADDAKFNQSPEGRILLNALAVQIGAANQPNELADFLAALDRVSAPHGREWMASLLTKLPAKSRDRISKGKPGELFKQLLDEAKSTATNEKRTVAERAAAVRTLGLAEFDKVKPAFLDFLKFRQPEAVQKAALEAMSQFEHANAHALIIDAWPGLSPQVRATAAETLFSRPASINAFLDAVEKGTIKTGEVDPARIKLLHGFSDVKIRARAEKLFAGSQLSKRKDVVEAYQKSLTLKGNAGTGKEHFKKHCAVCHRLEGVGEEVGANLNGIKDRGVEFLLLNILDPNREVLPKFITYYIQTDTGRTLTGMITSETATSITIRRADATSETILRVNIEELRSTGISFMPEGLEKSINHQEMADLIAYLMSVK